MGAKLFTKDELETKINEYFNQREILKEVKENIIYKPKTIEGLACFLGITRATLNNYEKDEKFSELIILAKDRCSQDLVNHSLVGTYNANVSLFLLKNNHGYKDSIELENKGISRIEITRAVINSKKDLENEN